MLGVEKKFFKLKNSFGHKLSGCELDKIQDRLESRFFLSQNLEVLEKFADGTL